MSYMGFGAIWYGALDSCRNCAPNPYAQMSVAAVATRVRAKPIFADFAFLGWSIIAYCLLPMPGWMHSVAWMHPPGPVARHPGRAAECIGRRMHSAAECIRQPNAFRGSMHSEAVCIQAAECIQPGIGNRQYLNKHRI